MDNRLDVGPLGVDLQVQKRLRRSLSLASDNLSRGVDQADIRGRHAAFADPRGSAQELPVAPADSDVSVVSYHILVVIQPPSHFADRLLCLFQVVDHREYPRELPA